MPDNKNIEFYLFKLYKYLAKTDAEINKCGCARNMNGGNQDERPMMTQLLKPKYDTPIKLKVDGLQPIFAPQPEKKQKGLLDPLSFSDSDVGTLSISSELKKRKN
jgi:hypothetical protein